MAIPTASDNEFPKIILEEVTDDGSATVTPAADHRALFLGEDGTLKLKDSAGAVTQAGGDVSAHTGDTSDAHDASAISVADAGGYFTGTDVEAALQELGAGGGGGGGGISRLGTTTPGGSTEQFTTQKVIGKKVTVPGEGVILSIGMYLQPRAAGSTTAAVTTGVWDDNSATIGTMLHWGYHLASQALLGPASGTFPGYPRWVYMPAGVYVAAGGDYWVGLRMVSTTWDIFYAASGSDRTIASGGTWMPDGAYYSQTDSTRNYSIHAVFQAA